MMAGDADWTDMNRACDPVQEVSLSLASPECVERRVQRAAWRATPYRKRSGGKLIRD